MDISDLAPKKVLPTMKENYIKAWNIWWGLHKKSGRFTLFRAPILIIEFIILAWLAQNTGIEWSR